MILIYTNDVTERGGKCPSRVEKQATSTTCSLGILMVCHILTFPLVKSSDRRNPSWQETVVDRWQSTYFLLLGQLISHHRTIPWRQWPHVLKAYKRAPHLPSNHQSPNHSLTMRITGLTSVYALFVVGVLAGNLQLTDVSMYNTIDYSPYLEAKKIKPHLFLSWSMPCYCSHSYSFPGQELALLVQRRLLWVQLPKDCFLWAHWCCDPPLLRRVWRIRAM